MTLQTQGVLDVIVNVRMTVVRLRNGGLFIHAPVAPTTECLRLLAELQSPVLYIVLPTSAVEHKVRPLTPLHMQKVTDASFGLRLVSVIPITPSPRFSLDPLPENSPAQSYMPCQGSGASLLACR